MNNKVCLSVFSDGVGGAEQVVKKLAYQYSALCFEVLIVTNDELAGYFKDLDGVVVFSIGRLFPFGQQGFFSKVLRFFSKKINFSLFYIFAKTFLVKRYLERNEFNIIHSHLMYDLALVNYLKYFGWKGKTFYTLHGFLNLDPDVKGLVFSNRKFIKYLSCLDNITCVSSGILTYINDNYPVLLSRTVYISNAVDASIINRQVIGDHVAPINFIFVGGDKYVKGGDLLRNSIEYVAHTVGTQKFNVFILGPVSQGSSWYELSQKLNNINIIGFVQAPEHIRYIRDADILIMPSRTEGYPLAVLEAFSQSVGVIGSNIPSLVSLLNNEAIFEFDSISLGDKMIEIINSPEEFVRIKSHALEYVIPTWNVICEKYIQIYNR